MGISSPTSTATGGWTSSPPTSAATAAAPPSPRSGGCRTRTARITRGVGDLIRTPFGWGTSTLDYDNDGDADIIFHGSIDILNLVLADNPGVLLRTRASAPATSATTAGACSPTTACARSTAWRRATSTTTASPTSSRCRTSTSSRRRLPAGGPPRGRLGRLSVRQRLAVPERPDRPHGAGLRRAGEPFPTFPTAPRGGDQQRRQRQPVGQGDLVGSAGILSGGTVNRDGIGSTVFVTPDGGKTSIYRSWAARATPRRTA